MGWSDGESRGRVPPVPVIYETDVCKHHFSQFSLFEFEWLGMYLFDSFLSEWLGTYLFDSFFEWLGTYLFDSFLSG